VKTKLLILLAVFFFVNLGFNLQVADAYDPWGQMQRWQKYNPAGMGWGGAPMSGPGFNSMGYNFWNPYAGPSLPTYRGWGSISSYDYTYGAPIAPGSGGGWDGYAYGTFQPGAWGLYGMYGFNRPNPFGN
jgi:hypothetical protein